MVRNLLKDDVTKLTFDTLSKYLNRLCLNFYLKLEKILKVAPSTVSDGSHFDYKSAFDTELFSRL